MKRFIAALLMLCALFLAGCAKAEPPAAPMQSPPVETPAAKPEAIPPAPPADEPEELICGALAIPIPREYAALLVTDVEPEAWNEHWTPLFSISEAASLDAFERDYPGEDQGMGWLCSVSRLDRIGFEDWACSETPGTRLFAKAGEDCYYLFCEPTDVRLYRSAEAPDEASAAQWSELTQWAQTLPQTIIERNSLTAYDASELFRYDYTYGGEHVELGCRFPGQPMDLVILSLSQPVRQGEGGVWCVERVRSVYSSYDWTVTQLVFPAALGIDETAADCYARLQDECDAGEHVDLLTPEGAALDYARRVSWLFGEDVSATDFERIESLG
ncbi:MAG: hypothetical protein IJU66_01205 [Oscillospiraceae bacterium]|nr:hypothetical protein [Oscillospiraceae bacterium]